MENNTRNISDEVLLKELKNRFDDRTKYVAELELLNQKLRDVNKKLVESETMKSHFLSNMSNEIINPFSSIIGMAQIISQSSNIDEMKKRASILFDEAKSLDFQFKNIFWAAQIESGRIQLNTQKIDIIDIISNIIEKIQYKASKKNIIFELKTEHKEYIIYSDAYKIEAILENIFDNAVKFNRKDNKVIISLDIKETKLSIHIKDFGVGLSPADINTIFDRFKKLNEEIYTENNGQGLGLAVAKELTELLQGKIHVVSTINKGTIFSIDLPLNIDLNKQIGNNIFDDGVELF